MNPNKQDRVIKFTERPCHRSYSCLGLPFEIQQKSSLQSRNWSRSFGHEYHQCRPKCYGQIVANQRNGPATRRSSSALVAEAKMAHSLLGWEPELTDLEFICKDLLELACSSSQI